MIFLQNDKIVFTSNKQDIAAFDPSVAAAGCFLDLHGKFLLLKTANPNKAHHNTWGLPGGKIERGETPEDAVTRELLEETGLTVDKRDLEFVIKIYVRLKKLDYEFVTYKAKLHEVDHASIVLESHEHSEYRWVTPQESRTMDLIWGGKELVDYVFIHKK